MKITKDYLRKLIQEEIESISEVMPDLEKLKADLEKKRKEKGSLFDLFKQDPEALNAKLKAEFEKKLKDKGSPAFLKQLQDPKAYKAKLKADFEKKLKDKGGLFDRFKQEKK